MIENIENTIVAISTPPGKGGIAIIRLSGNQAIEIVSKIFKAKQNLENIETWKAVLGKIVDGNVAIDEVVAIIYKAPNSYTKENIVEINCHGGMYVSQRILELAIKNGARLAQPGEFTFRAFLNERIDLSQAEAVADLIHAKTEASLQASYSQLEGNLSQKILEISNRLVDFCSLLELELDFSEEDVEFVDRVDFVKQLKAGQQELEELISTYKIGRITREGIKLVIVGRPNVGKSSLLNRLIKEERAIVTEIPGTTRDPLEVQLDMNGILFRIFDTAGIKESTDRIEQEGIRRAKKHLETADIIIHLFDGSQRLENEDYEIVKTIQRLKPIKFLRVINKFDLQQRIETERIKSDDITLISISAINGDGIDKLEKELFISVIENGNNIFLEKVLVTNVRHWEALTKALEGIQKALAETEKGASAEFIALYLREALNYLEQITGKVTSEDILNNIFSKFCIGK
jgi:tRNA modification GTPase